MLSSDATSIPPAVYVFDIMDKKTKIVTGHRNIRICRETTQTAPTERTPLISDHQSSFQSLFRRKKSAYPKLSKESKKQPVTYHRTPVYNLLQVKPRTRDWKLYQSDGEKDATGEEETPLMEAHLEGHLKPVSTFKDSATGQIVEMDKKARGDKPGIPWYSYDRVFEYQGEQYRVISIPAKHFRIIRRSDQVEIAYFKRQIGAMVRMGKLTMRVTVDEGFLRLLMCVVPLKRLFDDRRE